MLLCEIDETQKGKTILKLDNSPEAHHVQGSRYGSSHANCQLSVTVEARICPTVLSSTVLSRNATAHIFLGRLVAVTLVKKPNVKRKSNMWLSLADRVGCISTVNSPARNLYDTIDSKYCFQIRVRIIEGGNKTGLFQYLFIHE